MSSSDISLSNAKEVPIMLGKLVQSVMDDIDECERRSVTDSEDHPYLEDLDDLVVSGEKERDPYPYGSSPLEMRMSRYA